MPTIIYPVSSCTVQFCTVLYCTVQNNCILCNTIPWSWFLEFVSLSSLSCTLEKVMPATSSGTTYFVSRVWRSSLPSEKRFLNLIYYWQQDFQIFYKTSLCCNSWIPWLNYGVLLTLWVPSNSSKSKDGQSLDHWLTIFEENWWFGRESIFFQFSTSSAKLLKILAKIKKWTYSQPFYEGFAKIFKTLIMKNNS